jgi:hypothetical protein
MEAHDLIEIERRLAATVGELQSRASAVAMSRQIKEFIGDQRKNLLAKYVAGFLKSNSATAAETLARANEEYQAELAALAETYTVAEKHLAKWDAYHCQLDALRSTLSLAKEQIKL